MLRPRPCAPAAASTTPFRTAGYAPLPSPPPPLPTDALPRLVSRHISLNPLESVATLAGGALHRLDLLLGGWVDRSLWLTWAAVLAVGATVAMGLGLTQQLSSGPPAWLLDFLEDRLGPSLLLAAARAGLVLAAAPLAMWHLRMWWAANMEAFRELLGTPSFPSDASLPITPSTIPSGAAATACICASALRLVAMTSAARAAASASPGAAIVAALAAFVSLVPIGLAAAATAQVHATPTAAAASAAAASAAAAPAATGTTEGPAPEPAPAPSSSEAPSPPAPLPPPTLASRLAAAAPLLLPALAADAALLAATAASATSPFSPGLSLALPLALASGSALSASLAALVLQPRMSERLDPFRALPGDSACVHISICTDYGAQIDTSKGKRPIEIATVGCAIDEFAAQRLGPELATQVMEAAEQELESELQQQEQQEQQGGAASSDSAQQGQTQQQQQQQQGQQGQQQQQEQPEQAAASGSGRPAAPLVGGDDEGMVPASASAAGPSGQGSASDEAEAEQGETPLPTVWDPLSPEAAQGTRRFCTPTFALLLDALVPGMLVGERVRVTVPNPRPEAGGYINPELVWWQPLEDVVAKFKNGPVPQPGQVFWFPLGPGPNDNVVPVRVNAVNAEFVELDGNDHIEGTEMEVEIELVRLVKQG